MAAKRRPKAPQVTISVTDTMIEQAKPRDSQHCMIADALKAAYPTAQRISVDLATIRFTDPEKGLRYTYLTPRSVQSELVKFDLGKVTDPFQFRVRQGQVTRSGRKGDEIKDKARQEAGRKGGAISAERLRKQSLRRSHNAVSERVGGKAPPIQRDTVTKVPFSRRRAFGLRALEY